MLVSVAADGGVHVKARVFKAGKRIKIILSLSAASPLSSNCSLRLHSWLQKFGAVATWCKISDSTSCGVGVFWHVLLLCLCFRCATHRCPIVSSTGETNLFWQTETLGSFRVHIHRLPQNATESQRLPRSATDCYRIPQATTDCHKLS